MAFQALFANLTQDEENQEGVDNVEKEECLEERSLLPKVKPLPFYQSTCPINPVAVALADNLADQLSLGSFKDGENALREAEHTSYKIDMN